MGNEQYENRASLCDRVNPKVEITLRVSDFGVGTEIKGIRCAYRQDDRSCKNPLNRSQHCNYTVPNF